MILVGIIAVYLYGMFVLYIWRKMFDVQYMTLGDWLGVICIGWFVSPLLFLFWMAMRAAEWIADRVP